MQKSQSAVCVIYQSKGWKPHCFRHQMKDLYKSFQKWPPASKSDQNYKSYEGWLILEKFYSIDLQHAFERYLEKLNVKNSQIVFSSKCMHAHDCSFCHYWVIFKSSGCKLQFSMLNRGWVLHLAAKWIPFHSKCNINYLHTIEWWAMPENNPGPKCLSRIHKHRSDSHSSTQRLKRYGIMNGNDCFQHRDEGDSKSQHYHEHSQALKFMHCTCTLTS